MKRGLSGVITTVILIGIALAVVGIGYFTVVNVMEKAGEDATSRSSSLTEQIYGGWKQSPTGLVTWQNDSSNIWCEGCNVGIGTTEPLSELHVNTDSGYGTLRLSGPTGGEIDFWNTGGRIYEIYTVDNTLRFYRSGDKVTFDASGNVGIGTTNPGTTLHIYKDSTSNHMQLTNNQTGETGANGLYIGVVNNETEIYSYENAAMKFGVDNSFDMTIATGGNVGIGTTNPSSKLHVVGKITATGGVDPPYVSYSGETHKSIKEYSKDVEEHEEIMTFWNKDSHRFEVYHIKEDKFYTITGELIFS